MNGDFKAMEFWTTLIVVKKEQSLEAGSWLKRNCTYVDNWCWIYEGDLSCLKSAGVKYNTIGEGAVPSIGDMSKEDLVKLCGDVFGVFVYNESYDRWRL